MAERQINIKVENLVPILQGGCNEIVCGNGTYTVLFDFDEEWAGLNTKTAIFVCGDTPLYSVFEGNICKVPEIDGGTVCYIGVVSGSIEDINAKADKRTTVWCSVKAKPSITSIAKEPLPPSQDVYVQFMALLNKYITGGGGSEGGNGKDGFSPIVNITPIENGYRVTITDINGDHSYEVFNGEKGERGEKGEQGVQGEQGIQGEKGDDYVLTEADKNDIANLVLANFTDVSEVGR